jgi:hypothetical protein
LATQNVKFYFGTQEKYDALLTKNELALYFLEDTQRLYKGDKLFATGASATGMVAGLMSKEDKIALDKLIEEQEKSNLSPIDGSIVVTDTENGTLIGLAISKQAGNSLTIVEDGVFVPSLPEISIPEFVIEKQEVADLGYAASYKLKRTVNGESVYVGDAINIGKDMVLQEATLEIVVEADVPYVGAAVGDPYIDMAFNDASASHVYIPVKGLVDTYSAGSGLKLVDGAFSVNIASVSNGLVAVDGALKVNLATATSAGAMSAADKVFINSIPDVYASKEFVRGTCEQVKYKISDTPYGTLVNYGEKEIRVMCPADAEFVKQSVGAGGNANNYYITFKVYAPNDSAVGYIEHLGNQVDAEILTKFSTDEYGRRYQSTWLGIASYDESSDSWTYYGSTSTANKYVGWDYQIDWYDADGKMVASDSVRINLSNEGCHNMVKPYYMSEYVTADQLDALEDNMNDSFSWGEL